MTLKKTVVESEARLVVSTSTGLTHRVNDLESKFEKARANYTQAKANLDKRRAMLSQWDEEVRVLEEQVSAHAKTVRDADIELKRLEARALKIIKDEKEGEV